MYLPEYFKEDDTEKLHQYIHTHSFDGLVIAHDKGVEAGLSGQ